MLKISVNEAEHKIIVPLQLTIPKSKIRIKNRSILNEYGRSVAVRRGGFAMSNYVEWQISYDVAKKEAEKLDTTLPETEFVGANGKGKVLYELSEYIWYFHKWGVISILDLKKIVDYLNSIKAEDLIDNHSSLQIDRSHPIAKRINGFNFAWTQVKYPLLIYKYDKYEIIAEIKIAEKQYAVGTQPMLYLCFPITELCAKTYLIGRVAEVNEIAYFSITKSNIKVFVETIKMFGILSENHRHDIIQIINTISA